MSFYHRLERCSILTCLFLALPANAHHSVGVFQTDMPIVLKGTIADVYFANPHSTLFIDITEDDGQVVRWAIENSSTLEQTRIRGFDRTTVKVGDPIEVCGYPPKRLVGTTVERITEETGRPKPEYWQDAERAITGRLLVLNNKVEEHWSHYGPLDVCRELLGLPPSE